MDVRETLRGGYGVEVLLGIVLLGLLGSLLYLRTKKAGSNGQDSNAEPELTTEDMEEMAIIAIEFVLDGNRAQTLQNDAMVKRRFSNCELNVERAAEIVRSGELLFTENEDTLLGWYQYFLWFNADDEKELAEAAEEEKREEQARKQERNEETDAKFGCGIFLLIGIAGALYWANPADFPRTLVQSWISGDTYEETKLRRVKAELLTAAICYASERCVITKDELEDAIALLAKYPELLSDPAIRKLGGGP